MQIIRKPLAALIATATMMGATCLAQDAAELNLTADKVQLIYDIKELTAKAGQLIKLTFVNPADSTNMQPHNVIIGKAGSLQGLIAAANDPANFADPSFLQNPVPKSDLILHHSKLLKPGESETLEFTLDEPGDYPYVCTYPGHAILMNGILKVTE